MEHELLKYIIIVVIAGILSSSLSIYALVKLKDAPGAKYYILVTFLSAIFTFSYSFELASISLESIKFWLRVEYLALPFIPTFLLLMCYEYVGQKLPLRVYYSLFVIPIITIFMHSTNDLHHLYYTSVILRSDTPFPIVTFEYGPWFYVHSIYVFLCFMISIIVLLMQMKNSLFRFRMQILLMVTGLVVPIIASHFYLEGSSPYGIDLGPVFMSVSFLLHGSALLSFQMFNVAPIAREKVFENMQGGVIVLNQKGKLVDYNHAILNVIPTLNRNSIGKTISHLLENNHQQLAEFIEQQKECDYEHRIAGEHSQHFQIRYTPIWNKNNQQQIGQIITFINITERVNMHERLEYLASIDGLTQVYNRTFFMQKAEGIFNNLHTRGACIMFDIDHFKIVNDTYGHEAGDQVLTSLASLVKKSLRTTDILGRYGGEEFIIFLPDTLLSEAIDLANTLKMKISEASILIGDKEISVTSSFGISTMIKSGSDQHQSLNILMRQADQALYEAKRSGRNCVQGYDTLVQCIQ
ncbi:histidine kinase N-terminal 7TM domain-containing diguanylate cyclase [Litchfieldia salsa]|uniref:Diguanylate cyclase (GGDEF) domain-containing protein n=1 Tax=Litchfieldia salsa TaxID=930152 RepID=A0A1H0USY2_9BACI|nr:histidine kinase N-terminal 7TM domain-containing protein [Litchfieldia salsa]SDP69223.1 diguanylate cyclase (GGDEF) domain-containing protein [Litchfieldia salsa]